MARPNPRRSVVRPKPLGNELLDRLTSTYRHYHERKGWLCASIDLADLKIILEANGVENLK